MTSRYLRKSQSKNRLKCSRRTRFYHLVIIMSNGGLPKTSLGQPSELRWFWHWDRRRASPTSACAAKLIGLYLSIQKTSQIYQAKLWTARFSTLTSIRRTDSRPSAETGALGAERQLYRSALSAHHSTGVLGDLSARGSRHASHSIRSAP
jgi:hypothetical protein